MSDVVAQEEVPIEEMMKLCYDDLLLYGSVYFPRAFSQGSPEFHREIAEALETVHRQKAIMMFRGAAKTTLTRVFTSKRIAYGVSRTILYVSKSQDHSIKSIRWLQNQITHNSYWANTFKLTKAVDPDTGRARKWTDEWICIHHGLLGIDINVLAFGITGQIRGINIDDARPDLIIGDDIIDDENAHTLEQREKIKTLFYGALMKSLVPSSENPDACAILLQTPIHKEDLVMEAMESEKWLSLKFSCFNEEGQSRWPERWSTEDLLSDKEEHNRMRKMGLWNREMEVKVTNEELSAFDVGWLCYWEDHPEGAGCYMGIDPTPPPKDSLQPKNTEKLDYAVVAVVSLFRGRKYLSEYRMTKSPMEAELIALIFELMMRWRPLKVGVETILFQRTVKTSIEKEMHKRRQYFTIDAVEDKRNKRVRIESSLSGLASARTLYVHRTHHDFINQFMDYPFCEHDDVLDAVSIACSLINPSLEYGNTIEGDYTELDESEYEMLNWDGAP